MPKKVSCLSSFGTKDSSTPSSPNLWMGSLLSLRAATGRMPLSLLGAITLAPIVAKFVSGLGNLLVLLGILLLGFKNSLFTSVFCHQMMSD